MSASLSQRDASPEFKIRSRAGPRVGHQEPAALNEAELLFATPQYNIVYRKDSQIRPLASEPAAFDKTAVNSDDDIDSIDLDDDEDDIESFDLDEQEQYIALGQSQPGEVQPGQTIGSQIVANYNIAATIDGAASFEEAPPPLHPPPPEPRYQDAAQTNQPLRDESSQPAQLHAQPSVAASLAAQIAANAAKSAAKAAAAASLAPAPLPTKLPPSIRDFSSLPVPEQAAPPNGLINAHQRDAVKNSRTPQDQPHPQFADSSMSMPKQHVERKSPDRTASEPAATVGSSYRAARSKAAPVRRKSSRSRSARRSNFTGGSVSNEEHATIERNQGESGKNAQRPATTSRSRSRSAKRRSIFSKGPTTGIPNKPQDQNQTASKPTLLTGATADRKRLAQMSPAQIAMNAQVGLGPLAQVGQRDFYEFVLPSRLCQIVIGANGTTIRRIQARSDSKIKINRAADRGIPTAVVSIEGNSKLACALIEQELRIHGFTISGQPINK